MSAEPDPSPGPSTIVVDTSALMAILYAETDAALFRAAIVKADQVLISASTLLELTIVATRRTGSSASVETFVASQVMTVVPFDIRQLEVARSGFTRFGKGRHPAGLNYGDCFSYALARSRDLPLLWKGEDFSKTDVRSALKELALH